MEKTRNQLNNIWVNGYTPPEGDFQDLFLSFFNLLDDSTDMIINGSSVPGASVSDALDNLQTNIENVSEQVDELTSMVNPLVEPADLGIVLSQTNTVPSLPSLGDRYLAGVAPGSPWNPNNIYEWNGASWDETIPTVGAYVFVNNILVTRKWDGVSWVAYGGRAITQNGNSFSGPVKIGTNNNQDFWLKRNNILKLLFGSTVTTSYNDFALDNETAQRIAFININKKIKSLDTTTYPDLTELSYIKGLTSAIQTQINSKKTDSISTSKLLGRITAGTGAIEEIGLGNGLFFSGGNLNISAATNAGKVLYVSTTGSDTDTTRAGHLGDAVKPFLTLDVAAAAAIAGDLIYVFPGSYTVTTTATNGIAKDGVNYYFEPGAVVTKTNAGDIFNTNGFTTGFNVYGKGSFVRTTTSALVLNTGGYYSFWTPFSVTFECASIYQTAGASISLALYSNGVYLCGTLKFDELINTSTHAIVLDGGSTYANYKIDFGLIRCTAGICIGASNNPYYYADIRGNICISTSTYAISANAIGANFNIGFCSGVYNTWYAVLAGGNYQNFNFGNCTGVYVTSGYENNLKGRIDYLYISAGDVVLTSAKPTYLTQSGGQLKSSGLVGGTISGGVLHEDISGNRNYYNSSKLTITGGYVCISGLLYYNADAQQSDTFTINGANAVVDFKATIIMSTIAGVYGHAVPIQLINGKLKLKGKISNSLSAGKSSYYADAGACVYYTGGTLICDDATLMTDNSEICPITVGTAGLNLKVLSGGLNTNRTENGGTLAAKKQKYKYTVTAVATTSIALNDGTGGAETFTESNTGTYNTKALMAQQMAALINASGTLDITASQDTPGTDEYFYAESDVAGTPFTRTTLTNLTELFIRANSYAMTLQVGGTIIEDSNVE